MSAASEVLDHRDMENEVNDAMHMSNALCLLIEEAGSPTARGVMIDRKEWETITFAVYHSNKLLLDLKKRWQEIFDSNAVSKGGAA